MGCDAQAKLFLGFDLADEGGDFDTDNWDDTYCKSKGVVDDSGLFNEQGHYAMPVGPEREAAEKIWRGYLDRKRPLIKACPFDVGYIGSDGCTIPILYFKDRYQHVGWGESEEVDMSKLIPLKPPTEQDIAALKEFCEIVGLVYQEPKWRLGAYYG